MVEMATAAALASSLTHLLLSHSSHVRTNFAALLVRIAPVIFACSTLQSTRSVAHLMYSLLAFVTVATGLRYRSMVVLPNQQGYLCKMCWACS